MTVDLVPVDELEAWTAARGSVSATISARARREPGRTAVVDGDRVVTYGELARQADRVAATLRRLGVGPGACVAVLLERSAEFVATAWAVWRLGGAYLPLDTATPAARIEFVLADARAAAVVTRRGAAPPLRPGPWRTLDLDDPDLAPGRPEPPVDPAPESPAYVIYTSGSTGRPKGVELTHANLTHLVDWHLRAFDVTDADRASQVAGVGFDAAVWEIWPYLAAGGSVHLVDEATRRSPQRLRDRLVAERITVGFVPTVLAEQLIQLPWPRDTALRTLLTGADVLHRRPPHGLPFTLVNNYGPSECTVVATSGRVEPDGDGPPSIGRPLPGTTALVLDEELRPVAPGERGELCLAGPHVGRGYRHDPELTGHRFVLVEREVGPPLRVYRTGDVVRLCDDGTIAFLGRSDRQVKIRGYRIEPAEVVAALDLAPAVGAGAVAVRTIGGAPELVAYVVAGAGTPSAPALRAFLAARLPDYMIPSWFVGVDALPLTLNGKLDEAALPMPGAANLLPGQADPAAGAVDGSVEGRLAEMVRGLLGLPSVGPGDNIFLIGGHSMLAMQLVARIKQSFGVRLTLRALFEHPTVAELAAVVASRTAATGGGAG